MEVWFEGVVEPAAGGTSRLVLPGGASLLCVETPAGRAVASVHPEDVLLFLEAPVAGATTLRNVVEATVREIQSSGRSSRVVLDWAGGRLDASVTRAACEELDIHAGQIVHAAVKATAIQVLPRSVGR